MQILRAAYVSVGFMVVPSSTTDPAALPRVVIIGSGFGGAVAARRLAQSGRFDVLLLERGHRYEPEDFPKLRLPDSITSNPEWAYSGRIPDFTRLLWRVDRGLWDLRNLGELQTLQAAGLGGGSLVYAGVHYRAPDVVFRTWPRHRCQVEGCSACTNRHIDAGLLAPYYATVEAALGVGFSTQALKKTTEFEAAARKLNRTAEPTPLAIHFSGAPPPGKPRDSKPCTGCGQCISGCSDGGKNSLDRTYLTLAEGDGLRVQTLCEVTSIEALPTDSGSNVGAALRYKIHYRDHFLDAKQGHYEASYVFVCAGAVNSTELLRASVTCGHLEDCGGLENLGKRFWANGDAFAVAFDTRKEWESERGPTITRSLGHVEPKAPSQVDSHSSLSEVALAEEDLDPDWFLVQNGGLPPNLLPALSLLTSPALLAANAYASVGDASVRPSARRWDWLSRAANLNQEPNIAGLVQGLPPDVRALLPRDITYRALVLRFLASQVAAARVGMGQGAWYNPFTWARRFVLALFTERAHIIDKVRHALSKQSGFGPMLDVAHSVALGAYAIERYVLGPRPNRNTAVFLAMGADAEWELTYSPEARHRLYARTKDKERVNRLYRVEERLMRDLAKAAEGQLRTNPAASVGKRPITVHGQGGCPMGSRPDASVVDPTGEVWGHPGLFVLDGSILPSSVGVNPSHTIAALSELNVTHFLERTALVSTHDLRHPPIPPIHKADAPKLIPSVRPASGLRPSQMPRVTPDSDPFGKPTIEYVPIGTSPTTFVWEERMAGFVGPVTEVRPGGWVESLHEAGTLIPDDYQERYHHAVFNGCAVDLRLRAVIPDLDAFLTQREPRVDLRGTMALRVSSPVPHVRTYSAHGSMKMRFEVAGKPGKAAPVHGAPFLVPATPTMNYAVELEPTNFVPSRGTEDAVPLLRRLWGTKLLVDDPGLDAWQDMTTLYSDIEDADGNVCLSGIVRVSLQDFINQQLPSYAVDPEGTAGLSRAQRALALGRFLKRFFGDLARLYDVGSLV